MTCRVIPMGIVGINVGRGYRGGLHVNRIVAMARTNTVDFGMERWRDISIV